MKEEEFNNKFSNFWYAFDMIDELEKAEKQHPEWPKDVFHQASVISEELGEVHKALLDWKYFKKATPEDVKKELIQTGAMVMRMLKNFDKR